MITKWSVSNFKSIRKETTLALAPLTIFAGPNSSGKSTILQSILLISQTLAHKVGSRSVVLNGTLARLGQFDDLKSHKSEVDQITIGWECRPGQDNQFAKIENLRYPGYPIDLKKSGELIKNISCKLSFDTNPGSPDRDMYQIRPKLFLFSILLHARTAEHTDQSYEMTISRTPDKSSKFVKMEISVPDEEITRLGLEYDIVLDRISLEEIRSMSPHKETNSKKIKLEKDSFEQDMGTYIFAEPFGCILRHFLPDRLSVRVSVELNRALLVWGMLINGINSRIHDSLTGRELVIPTALLDYLQNHFGKKHPSLFEKKPALLDLDTGISAREWIERLKKLSPGERHELHGSIENFEFIDFIKIIIKALNFGLKFDEPLFKLLQYPLPFSMMNASAYLEKFFSNDVKYLGPLRDEPKAVYPLAAHADPTDVGNKGEMTAAVLNLHREQKIRYIPSAAFGKAPFDPTPIVRSLNTAVNDWLRYLGVADFAHSVDKGKQGHELKVSLDENGPGHDLTHVGVGVSQVLPILVMSLLADRETTLIFEQPELHLHPKVQTRLGDFFLTIALTGRQCLIETHSEYLINRLRFRAAAHQNADPDNKSNPVTDNLKMYFVEKIDGESNFREVEVNEYGAILDWPEGFFDQSQDEAEAIIRASVAKQKKRRER